MFYFWTSELKNKKAEAIWYFRESKRLLPSVCWELVPTRNRRTYLLSLWTFKILNRWTNVSHASTFHTELNTTLILTVFIPVLYYIISVYIFKVHDWSWTTPLSLSINNPIGCKKVINLISAAFKAVYHTPCFSEVISKGACIVSSTGRDNSRTKHNKMNKLNLDIPSN